MAAIAAITRIEAASSFLSRVVEVACNCCKISSSCLCMEAMYARDRYSDEIRCKILSLRVVYRTDVILDSELNITI